MKKYYCPITNEQFNQLINFGQIFISQSLIVDHGDDFELVQTNLVNTFVNYIQFNYDEEYLVLEVFADLKTEEKTLLINIYNVESVFPISDECYKAVTFKHTKIEFSKPILSLESILKINDAFFLSDSKNGIECLMSIFKNVFESTKPKNDEVLRAASKFRKREKLISLQSDSNIIDFVFLYVYQAYYPLTTLGYFYRTSEILTRKALIGKSISYNHEILEKTEIYKLLEEIKIDKPEFNLQEIISILERDDRATKFIGNLSDADVKYYIVIPMFLKIVDEFNDNNQNIEKTSLEKLIKHYSLLYKKECQQLVLWLGAYLGYGNCYDYFYLKSNLKFFKSYKPIAIIQEDKIITEVESKIITEELATHTLEGNVEKQQVLYDEGIYDKKNQKLEKIEDPNNIILSKENQKANSLQLAETSYESRKDETENFDKKDGEQNLVAKNKVITNENEGQENLAIVSEKIESFGKLRTDEKNSILESNDTIHNEVEQAKHTEIEKIADDTFEKFRNIIEDLLNQQSEVKLTEINSNIKKHFSNENKSVSEIKKVIIALKIQVESVTGKTNTIKRING